MRRCATGLTNVEQYLFTFLGHPWPGSLILIFPGDLVGGIFKPPLCWPRSNGPRFARGSTGKLPAGPWSPVVGGGSNAIGDCFHPSMDDLPDVGAMCWPWRRPGHSPLSGLETRARQSLVAVIGFVCCTAAPHLSALDDEFCRPDFRHTHSDYRPGLGFTRAVGPRTFAWLKDSGARRRLLSGSAMMRPMKAFHCRLTRSERGIHWAGAGKSRAMPFGTYGK